MPDWKEFDKAFFDVLKAVKEQRGVDANAAAKIICVPSLSDVQVNNILRIQSALGLVAVNELTDAISGTSYIPKAITWDGEVFLQKASKEFWELAVKAAGSSVEVLTGIDFEPFIGFFSTAYHKWTKEL